MPPDEVHLEEYVKAIAKLAAREAVNGFGGRMNGFEKRLRAMELNWAKLIGAGVGTGLLSGVVARLL